MTDAETMAARRREVRESLDRSMVARLSQPSHRRVLADLAADWGMIVLAMACVSVFPFAWVWGLAFVIIGSGQYRLFVLGHDGLHGCLHQDRRTNDLLAQWLVYGPLLTGFADSRRSHLQHHDRLATPDDPERYLYSVENKNSKLRVLLLCTGLLTFVRTVEKVVPYRDFGQPDRLLPALRQRLPVLIAQLAILAMMIPFFGLPWWSYFVLWLAPIYVLVYVVDEIRSYCDHAVLAVPDAEADDARLITFKPGPLERLLLAPHNLNFQAEHHAFPEVPYHALPELHAELGQHRAVTVRGGYARFLGDTLAAVPLRPDD